VNKRAAFVTLWHYMKQRYGRRWKDRASFERWQARQIARHLRFVRDHSPFYQEHWEGYGLDDWRRLPTIDKQLMMERFDGLNTAGVRKDEAMRAALAAEASRDWQLEAGGITVGLSSGTSGSRGLFLVSDWERAAWAGTMLAKLLPGPIWRRERVAFFLRANSKLYESVGSGRLQFVYYDLLEPLDRHAKRLARQQPTIVAAPPSVLRLLAEAQRDGKLAIAPRRVIAAAEVLDPLDARLIEETFGTKLHQVYQCTEGFLACTCAHGTLHLNEDLVAIEKEYADASSRRFVPIVTDYTRVTQPIIRYRLNDLLTEAEAPCPCGSVMTAIERIEGRCDDIFYLAPADRPTERVPVYPDYLSRAVIAVDGVEEYRVRQLADDRVEVQLRVPVEGDRVRIERETADSLRSVFERFGCAMPQLSFRPYRFEPGAVKLRRIERSCPP